LAERRTDYGVAGWCQLGVRCLGGLQFAYRFCTVVIAARACLVLATQRA